GLAVAVGVFHEQDVRGAGDDQAALPRQNAAHFENLVGEDGAAVRLAVAVGIFEQHDAGAGGVAGRGVFGGVEPFGGLDTAVFVEDNFDRIDHQGFGSEQLDVEIFAEAEALQGGVGLERLIAAGVLLFSAGGEKQEDYQQEGLVGRPPWAAAGPLVGLGPL